MDHIDIDGVHLNGELHNCRSCVRMARNIARKQEIQNRLSTRVQFNFDFGSDFWLMLLSFVIMMYTLFLLLQFPSGPKWLPTSAENGCTKEEGSFGKEASQKVKSAVDILQFCFFCGRVSTFSLLSCTCCKLSTPAQLLVCTADDYKVCVCYCTTFTLFLCIYLLDCNSIQILIALCHLPL